ncbi:MAG: CBS domain-containing protein [Gaiella sp.]|nr:CBS domain-containing protein [Gaiella sp.]
MTRDEFSVLIAGGGVAALEAALTLRELGEGRVRVELLAPEPSFWYRPVAVAEPFGLGEVRHFDLGELAEAVGAGLTLGTLAGVDVDRREARTGAGAVHSYDALLVACGAVPRPAVTGALTFRGPADSERMRALLDEIDRGEVTRVAFAVPWGATWALPAYELALMTAAHLAAVGTYGIELTLVTPEAEPLQLFGRSASDAVGALLDEAGVTFAGGVYPVDHRENTLLDLAGGEVHAERVVAPPRLRGQRIHGIPQTVERFLDADEHCGVRGADAVFAAGDITSFPIKQGGIAAQQAVAAAEAIAVLAGASLVPHPFRPVLRGLLLTGGDPQYLRRDLTGGDEPDWASSSPIWWPPTKIVGRRLAPFLAALTGEVPVSDVPPPAGGLPVDVQLDADELDRFAIRALDTPATATARPESRSVGDVMRPSPPAVGPNASLDGIVRVMREHDIGSVLVVEDEQLVGILTARDVLRAVAGDVSPSTASVLQWMTASPITVSSSTTLDAAETLMTEYGIHHLPVVEEGRPVGMVGLRDLARSQRDPRRLPVGLGF